MNGLIRSALVAGLSVLVLSGLSLAAAKDRLGGYAPETALAQDGLTENVVAVFGEGKAEGTPDVAYLDIGATTRGSTSEEALRRNNEIMEAVIAKAVEIGVPREDIKTVYINIWPDYYYPPDGVPVLRGYQATHQLEIKVTNMDLPVWVLDAAVSAGANQVSGIRYSIQDMEGITRRALSRAVENARGRGDTIASALGLRVVGVISVNQGGYYPPPIPYFGPGKGGEGVPSPVVQPATPVQPGQIVIYQTVTAVFKVGQ